MRDTASRFAREMPILVFGVMSHVFAPHFSFELAPKKLFTFVQPDNTVTDRVPTNSRAKRSMMP